MTMRFIHDNLYPLFATLTIVAAVICWFGAPGPAQLKASTPSAESWSLPEPARHDSKKPMAAINARNLWGAAASEPAKEPEWRVLGVALSGEARFILLSVESKPVEMLKVGDTLPDGSEIVQIEKDRFFVMTADKQKHAFEIYKHDPTK